MAHRVFPSIAKARLTFPHCTQQNRDAIPTIIIIIEVTNTGKNFPTAYSFTKFEATILFSFIFNYIKYWVFSAEITEYRVVLDNQAKGLITAMPIVIPKAKLQYYNQHVSKNIAKRLAEKRYLVEEHKEIMNYVQQYIQNVIEVELVNNRAALINKLKIGKQSFVAKYQVPAERKFISYYIKRSPNLGYNSS